MKLEDIRVICEAAWRVLPIGSPVIPYVGAAIADKLGLGEP